MQQRCAHLMLGYAQDMRLQHRWLLQHRAGVAQRCCINKALSISIASLLSLLLQHPQGPFCSQQARLGADCFTDALWLAFNTCCCSG
jgi:hypothetical protein